MFPFRESAHSSQSLATEKLHLFKHPSEKLFLLEMEDNKTVINSETMHEVFAKDCTLRDVRKRKSVRNASGTLDTEVIHTRTITNKEDEKERSYTVKMTDTDGQGSKKKKETDMSHEELLEFEKQWNSLWKPELFGYDDEN